MALFRERVKNFKKYSYPLSTQTILGVDWCGEFDCEPDFFISRNNVDFYVLIYTLKGKGVIEIGGVKHYAEKNTLAIVGGSEYSYYVSGNEWTFKFLHVKGIVANELLTTIIKNRGVVVPFYNDGEIFNKIINKVSNLEGENVVSNSVYNLIANVYYGENTAFTDEVVSAVESYVTNNLSGDLSVEKLAKIVNLSRPYFSQYFTKKCGKSPSNYVIEERLKRARHLLYTTQKPISEISALCGYLDVSSFIRLFKKFEGQSPYKFRKNNLNR
jgi:AraC-like DNA-binding protein